MPTTINLRRRAGWDADFVVALLGLHIESMANWVKIQFSLGHVSIQNTERYLGCKQKFRDAVNAGWASSRKGMDCETFRQMARPFATTQNRNRRAPVMSELDRADISGLAGCRVPAGTTARV